MTQHYVFIPHRREHAKSSDKGNVGRPLTGTATQWATVKSEKFDEERIICSDEQFPAEVNSAGSQTSIYVLGGHCTPCSDFVLYNGEKVTFTVMADRLCGSGLTSSFAGKIKVYSCDSGTGQVMASLSFATKFADYMRAAKPEGKGIVNASYFGYQGLISMPYENLNRGKLGMRARLFKEIMDSHCVDVDSYRKLVTEGHAITARFVGAASERRVAV